LQPYYDDGRGIVSWHADCRDVLPAIPAGSVDLVLTDPPYEAEAHTLGRRGNTARDGDDAYFATRPVDFHPIDSATRNASGADMSRVARGWVLVFCQVEAAMLWRDALVPARYMRTQVWRKVNGAPQFTGDRPGMGYESIVTAWSGPGRSHWNGGGRHGVYDYDTVRNGTGHQTEKPLPLIVELVTLFSDPGALILDPFVGSGTTLLAAKLSGCRAIGIEIDERWAEVAAKRLSQEILPLEPPAPEPTQMEMG